MNNIRNYNIIFIRSTIHKLFWIQFFRIANIYPCSWLINLRRPISKKIPTRFQHALWFSGKHDGLNISKVCIFVFFCIFFKMWNKLMQVNRINESRTQRSNGLCSCITICCWSSQRLWSNIPYLNSFYNIFHCKWLF